MITEGRPDLASARGATLERCGRLERKHWTLPPRESDTCDGTQEVSKSTMPELPEVETVRRDLAKIIVGKRVVAVRGPGAQPLNRIRGLVLEDLRRRGKYLLAALGELELIIHLGMSGRLLAAPKVPNTPYVRLVIDLEDELLLVFVDRRRFGRVSVVPRGDYHGSPTLLRMGPEPLSGGFSRNAFERQLGKARAPIKAVLLNQRVVAGIGNIYADEVLHRARIYPGRRQVTTAEAVRLHTAIRTVLGAAVRHRGTSFSLHRDGLLPPGSFGRHLRVFQRAGAPCRSCGTAIEKIQVASRTTYFCPSCQASSGMM
jgi:formamidopyrimidine-DNA glycosylase